MRAYSAMWPIVSQCCVRFILGGVGVSSHTGCPKYDMYSLALNYGAMISCRLNRVFMIMISCNRDLGYSSFPGDLFDDIVHMLYR